jgi:hypothetical protein
MLTQPLSCLFQSLKPTAQTAHVTRTSPSPTAPLLLATNQDTPRQHNAVSLLNVKGHRSARHLRLGNTEMPSRTRWQRQHIVRTTVK